MTGSDLPSTVEADFLRRFLEEKYPEQLELLEAGHAGLICALYEDEFTTWRGAKALEYAVKQLGRMRLLGDASTRLGGHDGS